MTLPKFYVGQRVVAIEDHSQGAFKKGNTFTVTSVIAGCCSWEITIGIVPDETFAEALIECTGCGRVQHDEYTEWRFMEDSFAPIHEDFQKITFEKIIEQESVSVN